MIPPALSDVLDRGQVAEATTDMHGWRGLHIPNLRLDVLLRILAAVRDCVCLKVLPTSGVHITSPTAQISEQGLVVPAILQQAMGCDWGLGASASQSAMWTCHQDGV